MIKFLSILLYLIAHNVVGQENRLTTSENKMLNSKHIKNSNIGSIKIQLQPTGTYNSVKNSIRLRKAKLNSKKISHDSLFLNAKTLFENAIINELVPFWYGTEWDFNGYTEIPKKGYIACGYLVSTVLLHSGLSINRYLLAQQSPISEALSIQINDSVQIYYSGTKDFITTFKANNPEGLYFVGLDSHVGFLLYRSKELYFIHSSYLVPLCVVIEKAAISPAFNASSTYIVAQLSNNRNLIRCWLNNTPVKVVKDL